MRLWGRAVAAALLIASPAVSGASGLGPGPSPATLHFTGYVVDQAGLLDPAWRRRLTERLGRFQRETRHQLAIVTVSSLSGQDVAAFTLALARRWGVGRRGVNDGIVILVAPNERKARIAVGTGLERQLTNRFCADVLATKMVPAFSEARYGEGLYEGATAIMRKLEGAR